MPSQQNLESMDSIASQPWWSVLEESAVDSGDFDEVPVGLKALCRILDDVSDPFWELRLEHTLEQVSRELGEAEDIMWEPIIGMLSNSPRLANAVEQLRHMRLRLCAEVDNLRDYVRDVDIAKTQIDARGIVIQLERLLDTEEVLTAESLWDDLGSCG